MAGSKRTGHLIIWNKKAALLKAALISFIDYWTFSTPGIIKFLPWNTVKVAPAEIV